MGRGMVGMHDRMIAMLGNLREQRNFEEAAIVLMQAVMDTGQVTLDANRQGSGERILRAMVHHRPSDGYRRLAVLDADHAASSSRIDEAFLPSATAWRWIVEHRRPASIDVNL